MDKSYVEELPAAVRRIFYLSAEGTHIQHEASGAALGPLAALAAERARLQCARRVRRAACCCRPQLQPTITCCGLVALWQRAKHPSFRRQGGAAQPDQKCVCVIRLGAS